MRQRDERHSYSVLSVSGTSHLTIISIFFYLLTSFLAHTTVFCILNQFELNLQGPCICCTVIIRGRKSLKKKENGFL